MNSSLTVRLAKHGLLVMLSFLSFFCFSEENYLSNSALVERYGPLNGAAAKSINVTSMHEILSETEAISPLVSGIHQEIAVLLSEKSISRLGIQAFVVDKLSGKGLLPSMAGYKGFPSAIAVSVNKELIHNVPDASKIRPGSIVTVEIGASSDKAYASQTWSFLVPPVNNERKELLDAAKLALKNAIGEVIAGARLGDIGSAIQMEVESRGFSVVRDYCGYGMGKERIMEPQILGYGRSGTGQVLEAGQILNIHVMAIDGEHAIKHKDDGWGVFADEGKNSVALSAMVLVTDTGYKLLSKVDGI